MSIIICTVIILLRSNLNLKFGNSRIEIRNNNGNTILKRLEEVDEDLNAKLDEVVEELTGEFGEL